MDSPFKESPLYTEVTIIGRLVETSHPTAECSLRWKESSPDPLINTLSIYKCLSGHILCVETINFSFSKNLLKFYCKFRHPISVELRTVIFYDCSSSYHLMYNIVHLGFYILPRLCYIQIKFEYIVKNYPSIQFLDREGTSVSPWTWRSLILKVVYGKFDLILF